MESIIHYTSCPVCGDKDFFKVLTAVDQTVSKKEFEIVECSKCSLRFTQDVPDESTISAYYKSEEYISHTNTNKGFINKLYQLVRGITLEQKQRNIEKMTGIKNGRLLDVGSGAGLFVRHMKDKGWEVTGLEPDADARKQALSSYAVLLEPTEAMNNLEANSFDAITLWHVLEHVHELDSFLEKLKLLLKPSGIIFIALPNYNSLDAKTYETNWAAYDVPRHLYHFNPDSINVLMKKHGLTVIKHHPMWFDSFYISLLSSKYKKGKVNYLSAFFTGLKSNISALANPEKCSSVIYLVKKETH